MIKNNFKLLLLVSTVLLVSSCSSSRNTLMDSFKRSASSPDAYSTYRSDGIIVPANEDELQQPNVESNFLTKMYNIQEKAIQALIIDKRGLRNNELEPPALKFQDSTIKSENTTHKKLIDKNSTEEEDILFDDESLFSDDVKYKTGDSQIASIQDDSVLDEDKAKELDNAKAKTVDQLANLDINSLVSVANNSYTPKSLSPQDKSFIRSIRPYILFTQDTEGVSKILANDSILRHKDKRKAFYKLLVEEYKKGDKSDKYLLTQLGILDSPISAYVVNVKDELKRIHDLKTAGKKVTGDKVPMFINTDHISTDSWLRIGSKARNKDTEIEDRITERQLKEYHRKNRR